MTKPVPRMGGTSKVTATWRKPVLCSSLPHTSKRTILSPKGRESRGANPHRFS